MQPKSTPQGPSPPHDTSRRDVSLSATREAEQLRIRSSDSAPVPSHHPHHNEHRQRGSETPKKRPALKVAYIGMNPRTPYILGFACTDYLAQHRLQRISSSKGQCNSRACSRHTY